MRKVKNRSRSVREAYSEKNDVADKSGTAKGSKARRGFFWTQKNKKSKSDIVTKEELNAVGLNPKPETGRKPPVKESDAVDLKAERVPSDDKHDNYKSSSKQSRSKSRGRSPSKKSRSKSRGRTENKNESVTEPQKRGRSKSKKSTSDEAPESRGRSKSKNGRSKSRVRSEGKKSRSGRSKSRGKSDAKKSHRGRSRSKSKKSHRSKSRGRSKSPEVLGAAPSETERSSSKISIKSSTVTTRRDNRSSSNLKGSIPSENDEAPNKSSVFLSRSLASSQTGLSSPQSQDPGSTDEARDSGDTRTSLKSLSSRDPPDLISECSNGGDLTNGESIELVDMIEKGGKRYTRIISNNKVLKRHEVQISLSAKQLKRGGSLIVVPKITIFRKKEEKTAGPPELLSRPTTLRERVDSLVRNPFARHSASNLEPTGSLVSQQSSRGIKTKKSTHSLASEDQQKTKTKEENQQNMISNPKQRTKSAAQTKIGGKAQERKTDRTSSKISILEENEPNKIPDGAVTKAVASPIVIGKSNSAFHTTGSSHQEGTVSDKEIDPPEGVLNAYGATASLDSASFPSSRKEKKEQIKAELENLFGDDDVDQKKDTISQEATASSCFKRGLCFAANEERNTASNKSGASPNVPSNPGDDKNDPPPDVEILDIDDDVSASAFISWCFQGWRSQPEENNPRSESAIDRETETSVHRDPQLDFDEEELSRAIAGSIVTDDGDSLMTYDMNEGLIQEIREMAQLKLAQVGVISSPTATRLLRREKKIDELEAHGSWVSEESSVQQRRRRLWQDNGDRHSSSDDESSATDDDESRQSDRYSRADDESRQSKESRYSRSVYTASIYRGFSGDDDTTDVHSVDATFDLRSVGDDSTNVFSNLGSTVGGGASVRRNESNVFSNLGSTVGTANHSIDFSWEDDGSYSYIASCDGDDEDWEVVSVFELPEVDTASITSNNSVGRRSVSHRRRPNTRRNKSRLLQPVGLLQHPPGMRRLKRLDTLEEETLSRDSSASIDENEIEDLAKSMENIKDAVAVEDALAIIRQHAMRLGVDEKDLMQAFQDVEAQGKLQLVKSEEA